MKNALAVATCLAAFALAALAARAADATDPERLAEARAILAATHVEAQMDAMAGMMADSLTKQLSGSKAAANPRTLQVVMEESMRGMKEQMNAPGGMMDLMAQAYASQFTFAELRQIREFYESPAGQHMLLATPDLMKKVFPAMAETARRESPRSCARAKERLLAEKVEGAAAMTCAVSP